MRRITLKPSFLKTVGIALIASAATLGACSSSDEETSSTAACESSTTIDRFKELTIVDESVMTDQRARNDVAGPWSFRHAMEQMVPAGESASPLVRDWLTNWLGTTNINGFVLDKESRVGGMDRVLVCPWLKETPANACNEDCSKCTAREFDLAKAPFRLIAIVNRPDLGGRPGITSKTGEGRLVFALTSGPGDNPASVARPMTVIFEYVAPLPTGEWDAMWHHLSTHTAFDDAYKTELATVTERFVGRGTSPDRPRGSSLSQLRTNESAFNWIWQMREFHLESNALQLAPVVNTPGQSLNGSPLLRGFIAEKRDEVVADRHVLPAHMLSGSADGLLFSWTIPGVEEKSRAAFAKGTCNGCHYGETESVDTAFHVSPFKSGIAKLSPFVHNPNAAGKDELSIREKVVKQRLCGGAL